MERNESYNRIATDATGTLIRLLHVDHVARASPIELLNDTNIVAGWRTAHDALNDTLPDFSAACYYFAEALIDKMGDDAVPLGLIESSYGGTMAESWIDADAQLQCSNITCVADQSMSYDASTQAACLGAAAGKGGADLYPEYLVDLRVADAAGSNGFLYNGMIYPFARMALTGVLWYQGENNLAFHAGNFDDAAGYACLLPLLMSSWQEAFGRDLFFGVVELADSTDEGFGENVPQMHWAQTANLGYVPNARMPRAFFASAHDLPDPWDDDCWDDAHCCVDTGSDIDDRCDVERRGYLIQKNPDYPGIDQPVTQSMGPTIHPRIKRIIGRRLAQAAWAVVYGNDDEPSIGPVAQSCALVDGALQISFGNLTGGASLALSEYNRTENASAVFVKVNVDVPDDSAKNWHYANREAWWGDDDTWFNVDIKSVDGNVMTLEDLPENATAIQYGHTSVKSHPQSGHDKICCGNRDFKLSPCEPESCPLKTTHDSGLPAVPFMLDLKDGECTKIR